MKKFILHKCTFLFFIISIKVIFSQQLAFKNYTVEDGLVQSCVYTILQDREGYLWFGTEGGLSKFDGLKFTNYNSSNGLSQNEIRCLTQDKEGNIWIGTENKGVVKFDGKNFRIFDETNGLTNNTVLSIFQDTDNSILFGTDGGGITKLKNSKFYYITKKDGIARDTVRRIYNDSKGNIWFCYSSAGGGVTKYDGKEYKSYTTKDGLISDDVISICEDSQNNIWFGTYRGISKFDGKRFINFDSKNGLPNDPILTIKEDQNKIIWIGTYGGGLVKYENDKFSIYTIQNGLTGNIVYAIQVDLRGDVWLATNNGVNKIPAERFYSYTLKDGLPNEQVYAINQDRDGSIWLGTYGGGAIKIEGKKIIAFNSTKGFPDDYVSSIFVDRQGVVWFGTLNSGIVKLQDGKFTSYSEKEGLINKYVFTIAEDEKGNLWIGTKSGASYFDKKKFINFNKRSGLIGDIVYSIYTDKNGDVWFGTTNGVSKLYNGKFFNYTINDGLADNNVTQIKEDSFGNIWCVTQDGISKFIKTGFKSYKIGLSSNSCYSLIQEGPFLYIGTSNGINKIDLEDLGNEKYVLKPVIYTAKEGLAGSECTQAGMFVDKQGNLWFGTLKGVTVFNPGNQPNPTPPSVYLQHLKLFDTEIKINDNLSFSYNQNYINFEFNAVSFASPDKIKYLYALDGIDLNWKETNQRSITYPYLPPGTYNFKVKAINSDGIISDHIAQVSFIINPPFWSTFWFRTISSLMLVSMVYGIYLYKTKQVKRRNIELGIMVSERTKELELEKNKSDDLLQNILPVSLVEELKKNGFVQPREFKNISIMFTDFKGFTYIANILPADKLVKELNDIFKEFDVIIENHNLEKLKTIGDSYMVGAGLPQEAEDHAVRIITAGLEMQCMLKERNKTSAIKWEMRTGIHSGHVIAGVVGKKKFTYDIWGDTVNIASRMESAGIPGEINISAYTYMLIKDFFNCEYRGKVSTKGLGDLDMYFVKGKK
ncbi:MAG: triple tyrosine motif-containing protein [Ignavibacteriales bacterium]|nr:triple tyrosine motif-containing protein [Ignavibacteriales bacterium]